MAKISIRGVEKQYGAVTVLHDCNLDIAHKEFVVLVGPSGSGKTTLLRLISGLETISRGEMYFDDTRVNDLDVGDRDIAMVFQNYGLYPHMSVYDNMAFGLKRRRLPRAEIEDKVTRTAKLLSLEGLLQRRPKQLSGGQRQRVALGRAIVRDPAVFLLDEPLSNLDAQLRMQMRSEILRVHRSVDATAVYVTHDQVEAMTMGDRIVVMNHGRVQQVGTPSELYDHPVNQFVASFIGTPPMGFIDCKQVDREGAPALSCAVGEIPISRAQAARIGNRSSVVAGIRPEHIALPTKDEPGLRGIVEVAEMLGAEQHVHFLAGGSELTIKLPRDQNFAYGDPISFTVASDKLQFFDADTGMAL